jgi:flagellar biosynthetic protein FliR
MEMDLLEGIAWILQGGRHDTPAASGPLLALAAARMAGFMISVPFFSSRFLPFRFRAALAFLLAVLFATAGTSTPPVSAAAAFSAPAPAALALLGEVVVGLALGWLGFLVMGAVRGAAVLVSEAMGLSLGGSAGEEAADPALRSLQAAFALYVFLALDLHHAFLESAAESFALLPPGSLLEEGGLVGAGKAALAAGQGLFAMLVAAAFPVTAALILAAAAQGIAGRILPEVELLLFGFPVRAVLGMTVTAAALPFLAELYGGALEAACRDGLGLLEGLFT